MVNRPISMSFGNSITSLQHGDHSNHFSVLLGKNGQGKSRLLSAIATSFQLLQSYARYGAKKSLPLASLEYLAHGMHHSIQCNGAEITSFIEGKMVALEQILIPSKVIGLSMTPFDKFPIGNSDPQADMRKHRQDSLSTSPDDVYVYLGMRERMGRASTSALLQRAVEGVINRISSGDSTKLKHIFEMLGYSSKINVIYRTMGENFIFNLLNGSSRVDLLGQMPGNSYSVDRLRRELENKNNDIVTELREAAMRLVGKKIGRFVAVNLDVGEGSADAVQQYRDLQLFRKFGLARLFSVEVLHKNGAVIDLKEASSGELSIAITFMSLASNLENDSLILIDEPETNLHPEWQSKFIDLLSNTFGRFSGCHYVISTHSPMILSDAPNTATLASLNNPSLPAGMEVSNRPVDYLLVEAFDVASGENYYIQELLINTLRMVADGEVDGEGFVKNVKTLGRIRGLITDSPGVVTLIDELTSILVKRR